MTTKYKQIKIFKTFGEASFSSSPDREEEIKKGREKKIAFVHYPEKAKHLCETGKYDFVFYGHTHKPWTENIRDCVLLNPGNVANQIFPPTFAVWNTENDKLELVRVNDLK